MMLAAPIPQAQSFPEVLKTAPVLNVETKEPTPPPAIPPSPLQELLSVDRLHITKRLQLKSVLCLRGKKNRFLVRSSDQSLVYTIDEENRLQVFAPPGELLGTVEQQWTPVKPLYLVRNRGGDIAFWVYGPYITISCFSDVQFHITRPGGAHVGSTCKRWQGLMHALFFAPVSDRFGVAFDIDLTVEEKGLLLATTLLMEYMYCDA